MPSLSVLYVSRSYLITFIMLRFSVNLAHSRSLSLRVINSHREVVPLILGLGNITLKMLRFNFLINAR